MHHPTHDPDELAAQGAGAREEAEALEQERRDRLSDFTPPPPAPFDQDSFGEHDEGDGTVSLRDPGNLLTALAVGLPLGIAFGLSVPS